jgi:serine/threonine protein phosphatase PrpC
MNKPTWAAETHLGLHRQINEDRYAVFSCPLGEVFVVCDGMGGHEAGEVAATLAIQTIQAVLSQAGAGERPDYWLRRSLHAAHLTIQQAPAQGIGSSHMGTTAVVLLLNPHGEAWWAHVGDSRLYLYRQGQLQTLTRDHSLVAWYVEAGFITPAQAYRHPESNQLLLSLGGGKDIFLAEASPVPLKVQAGDSFLLCSDGLSGYVPEETIAQILGKAQPLPEKVKALIQAALNEGGYDNVTAILVAPELKAAPSPRERVPYLVGLGLLITGVALLAGMGGFYLAEKRSEAPPPAHADSIRAQTQTSADSLRPDTSNRDSAAPAPPTPAKN